MNNEIKRPIFIFGCCNSGTTILWKTLKNHKELNGPDIEGQDIEGLPEVMKHYLGKCTFRLWAHPKFNLAYYVTENDFNKADADIVKYVFNQYLHKGTRLIVKSPADTLRARLIQAYFPDACFIGIVRNGYAVSEGIVRKRKYDEERPQFAGLFTSIDEAAEQWLRSNTIILSHKNYLQKYIIIKYEDLVVNTEETFNKLLDFLELEKAGFQIPDFEKGNNEEQIKRLSDYEIDTITRIAGPMLVHHSYDLINKKLNW